MKNLFVVLLAVITVVFTGFLSTPKKEETHTEYLRIHIRADSNSEEAQAVKYKVKDAVVEYLTPYLAFCDSKEKAEKVITGNLHEIERIADGVLKENGFSYKSNVKINNEKFPTRKYGEYTLESGFYDALIINLGSGKGDNWWCVVYPPLCFVGSGNNYIYKSKIYEIIKDFFN